MKKNLRDNFAKYQMDIDFVQFEDGVYPEITRRPLIDVIEGEDADDIVDYIELIEKITYMFNRTKEVERGEINET